MELIEPTLIVIILFRFYSAQFLFQEVKSCAKTVYY